MKVLRYVYERSLEDKLRYEDEIKIWQEKREEAREEGDLKENADYQSACAKLDSLYGDYSIVCKMIDQAEIVEEQVDFELIDVGCKFRLVDSLSGDRINGVGRYEDEYRKVWYDKEKDRTFREAIVVFGGPTDMYAMENILASNSAKGLALINKPFGTYNILNKAGEYVPTIVSHI